MAGLHDCSGVDRPALGGGEICKAQIPIPFSVFPSSYRNAGKDGVKENQKLEVETVVKSPQAGREGHSEHLESFSAHLQPAERPDAYTEDIRVFEDRTGPHQQHIHEEVHIHEETHEQRPQLQLHESHEHHDEHHDLHEHRPHREHRPKQHHEEIHVHEEQQHRFKQPQVHEEVHIHEEHGYPDPEQQQQVHEEVRIHDEHRFQQPGHRQHAREHELQHELEHEHVEVHNHYQPSHPRDRSYDREYHNVHGESDEEYAASQIDVSERQFRQHTRPIVTDLTTSPTFDQASGHRKESYTAKHDSRRDADSFDDRHPAQVRVKSARSTVDPPKPRKRDMGYYDNEGQYHSLRHGISSAAHKVGEKLLHPYHSDQHHHSHEHSFKGSKHSDRPEEIVVQEKYSTSAPPSPVHSHHSHSSSTHLPPPAQSHVSAPTHLPASSHSHSHSHAGVPSHLPSSSHTTVSRAHSQAPLPAAPVSTAPVAATRHAEHARPASRKMARPNTITIPCHHIRIGDLLILQGRPCQVIRITTSSQTGQHRYLGVDLFTKQLHEESSFISNPAPSVVVQNMLGPVFKQYRVLDIREDGHVVAMTESGDVKQGLPVIDQSGLLNRLTEAFDNGRGSVRILVINDDGMEMAVDYKVVHGSRL
ncbi:hypothetical protein P280DRAFT_512659 [Massarina eburnea CBS 473.64]|uniref:Uncharacterized protein n=1 Tax=Massarina eburnea CBS 473.64 TaxID=1395130 RepID=A0A6A6SHN1_9PLEO|nr:hypothetical protein P280DRAFT_512659 [Massarina eburnea CBS 473.64]